MLVSWQQECKLRESQLGTVFFFSVMWFVFSPPPPFGGVIRTGLGRGGAFAQGGPTS